MPVTRRNVAIYLGSGLAACTLPVASLLAAVAEHAEGVGQRLASVARLDRDKSFWRGEVSEESFAVLFREDTERPFTSPLNDEKRAGTYVCAACYLPLFSSEAKFDSGTGWPSFTAPVSDVAVGKKRDFLLLLPRTEYHCARCGGHQGHVFDDGPKPTGQRWCNNGVALRFVPADEALPALRG